METFSGVQLDNQIEKKFITYLVGKRALRPSTADCYVRQVRIFEKRYPALDRVRNEDVVNYLADMKLKSSKNANTRRLMKIALETFYNWYAPIVGIANPTKDLGRIKRYISHPKLIHPDELERMLHAVDHQDDCDWSRRTCAILALLADTGIRAQEFVRIKAGDVQLNYNKSKNTAHFELTVAAIKGTHSRLIPFSNLIEGSLAEYFCRYYLWAIVEKNLKTTQPLFFKLGNKFNSYQEDMNIPLRQGGLQFCINRAAFETGIDRRISPHQFRHFYGTYSIINGMDIWTLKYLMGHANIITTQSYIHLADQTSGKTLEHSPTFNIKSTIQNKGYTNIVNELARKINQ